MLARLIGMVRLTVWLPFLGVLAGAALPAADPPRSAAAKDLLLLNEQTIVHRERVHAVVFSADGKMLAMGNDNPVVVIDVSGYALKGRPPRLEHTHKVRAVAFAPDSKTLASVGEDGRLVLWEAATGKPIFSKQWKGQLTSVSVTAGFAGPKGRDLRVACGNSDGTVLLLHIGPPTP